MTDRVTELELASQRFRDSANELDRAILSGLSPSTVSRCMIEVEERFDHLKVLMTGQREILG